MIADFHKLSTSVNLYKNNQDMSNIFNICNNLNIKSYAQSLFNDVYFSLLMLIGNYCNINELDKIFKINYENNTDNNINKLLYPLIMLIDILLIQPCTVVISQDQIHNVRFIKKIIEKLKSLKINIDVDFEILDLKIISLYTEDKMSSSKENCGVIYLNDDMISIQDKIAQIPTQENMPQHSEDFQHPHLKQIYQLFAKMSNISLEELIDKYKDQKFSLFKINFATKIYKIIQEYKVKLPNDNKNEEDKDSKELESRVLWNADNIIEAFKTNNKI